MYAVALYAGKTAMVIPTSKRELDAMVVLAIKALPAPPITKVGFTGGSNPAESATIQRDLTTTIVLKQVSTTTIAKSGCIQSQRLK